MSTETLASHLSREEVALLVADLKAHLPCKERAASDMSAPEVVRRAVREEIAEDRTVLALLSADLQATPDGSERNRTIPNGPGRGTHQDRTGTETNA